MKLRLPGRWALRQSISAIVLIFFARAAVSGAAPDPAAQLVTYGQSASGELHGFLYKPPGKGPFPAVLWNHGSEKTPGWQPALGHFYASHGYVFFIPHRHGQGRSPGEYIGDAQKGLTGPAQIRRHELYNHDVEIAAAWLAHQPYVNAKKMVMSGLSYGGIQTILSAEKGMGMRAFVPFAPGAMSWARLPELGPRLLAAVRSAKAPIFLLQAQNDFSLNPYQVLGAALSQKGAPNQAKLYPAYGISHEDGHGGFATSSGGIAVWGTDVLSFIEKALN